MTGVIATAATYAHCGPCPLLPFAAVSAAAAVFDAASACPHMR